MNKRGVNLIEVMVSIAIIAMLAAIIIPCVLRAKSVNDEEEQAAANRARLAKIPVQTIGITPPPAELPEPEMYEASAKVEKRMVIVKCPHCNKMLRITLEE